MVTVYYQINSIVHFINYHAWLPVVGVPEEEAHVHNNSHEDCAMTEIKGYQIVSHIPTACYLAHIKMLSFISIDALCIPGHGD